MGLTSWHGDKPHKVDAEIAKNYLTVEELDTLNRIVNFYLEFAELQALSRKPMYMQDWITKLDDFLRLSERNILAHAGKISHEQAMEKAYDEYEKFRMAQLNAPSAVECHFAEAVKEVTLLEKEVKPQKTRKKNFKT